MIRLSVQHTPQSIRSAHAAAALHASRPHEDSFQRSPITARHTPALFALQRVHADPTPQSNERDLALLIGDARATALLQAFAAAERNDIAHWMITLFMVGDPLLNDGEQAIDLARVVAKIPAASRAGVLAAAQAKADELVPSSVWKDAITNAPDDEEKLANATQLFMLRWSIEAVYLVAEVAVTQAGMGAEERAEFIQQSGQNDVAENLPARVGYEFAAAALWYADLVHRLAQVPRSERPKWLEDTFLGPVEKVGNTLSSQLSEDGVQSYLAEQAAALVAQAKA